MWQKKKNSSTISNKGSAILAIFPNLLPLLTTCNWSHLTIYTLVQILFFMFLKFSAVIISEMREDTTFHSNR